MWETIAWVAGVWISTGIATALFLIGYALVKEWQIARQIRSFRVQLDQLPTTIERQP